MRHFRWCCLPPFLLGIAEVHASFSILPAGTAIQQCLPIELNWTEEPPVHLWANPNLEDSPGDTALHDFGVINSSSTLWTVNLTVGQNVSFTYTQTSNQYLLFASPQAYTVVAGTNATCLATSSSSSSSSSSSHSAPVTVSSTSSSPSQTAIGADAPGSAASHKPSAGLIAGLVTGGVAALAVLGCTAFMLSRAHAARQHRRVLERKALAGRLLEEEAAADDYVKVPRVLSFQQEYQAVPTTIEPA